MMRGLKTWRFIDKEQEEIRKAFFEAAEVQDDEDGGEELLKVKERWWWWGIGEDETCLLDVKDLDEDFDPEEYDKMMKVAFGEE